MCLTIDGSSPKFLSSVAGHSNVGLYLYSMNKEQVTFLTETFFGEGYGADRLVGKYFDLCILSSGMMSTSGLVEKQNPITLCNLLMKTYPDLNAIYPNLPTPYEMLQVVSMTEKGELLFKNAAKLIQIICKDIRDKHRAGMKDYQDSFAEAYAEFKKQQVAQSEHTIISGAS